MEQSQANQMITTSQTHCSTCGKPLFSSNTEAPCSCNTTILTTPGIVRDTVPCGIRWLVKKDGTRVLQAGYKATQGFTGAWTVWEDVEEAKEEETK